MVLWDHSWLWWPTLLNLSLITSICAFVVFLRSSHGLILPFVIFILLRLFLKFIFWLMFFPSNNQEREHHTCLLWRHNWDHMILNRINNDSLCPDYFHLVFFFSFSSFWFQFILDELQQLVLLQGSGWPYISKPWSCWYLLACHQGKNWVAFSLRTQIRSKNQNAQNLDFNLPKEAPC